MVKWKMLAFSLLCLGESLELHVCSTEKKRQAIILLGCIRIAKYYEGNCMLDKSKQLAFSFSLWEQTAIMWDNFRSDMVLW